MTADLTREQAREQVARAIRHGRLREQYRREVTPEDAWASISPGMRDGHLRTADAALSVLWPVVESLRAELAHAHTVIARHVEPRREGDK